MNKIALNLLRLVNDALELFIQKSNFGDISKRVKKTIEFIEDEMNEDEMNEDEINEKCDDISKLINCSRCSNEAAICIFECSHKFCKNCLKTEYTNRIEPDCAICSEPFDPKLIPEEIARKYNIQFDSKALSVIQCKHDQKTLCPHFCIECGFQNYTLKKFTCEICKSSPLKLLNTTALCAGCHTQVYLIGDFCKTICKNHVHCYKCLRQIKKNKCMGCKQRIRAKQMQEIKEFLDQQCNICGTIQPLPNFMFSTCCNSKVCLSCQFKAVRSGNKLGCAVCEQDLSLIALNQLSRFEESEIDRH